MKPTCIWFMNRWTSLRGSPTSAMPCWLRDTSCRLARAGASPDRSCRRGTASRGAGTVDALQIRPRRAEVADPVGVRAVAERRPIGGDVMGDELPEQGPARLDRRVGSVAIDPEVRRAARLPQGVQSLLVRLETGQILEQAAIAAAMHRRIDALGREAVVAGRAHEYVGVGGISRPSLTASTTFSASGRRYSSP